MPAKELVIPTKNTKSSTDAQSAFDYYHHQKDVFLESFDENMYAFEISAQKKIKELQALSAKDHKITKKISTGGIMHKTEDKESITKYYDDLKNQECEIQKEIMQKKNDLHALRQQFLDESATIYKLRQELSLKGLDFEAIIPKNRLKEIIRPLPLYTFYKDKFVKSITKITIPMKIWIGLWTFPGEVADVYDSTNEYTYPETDDYEKRLKFLLGLTMHYKRFPFHKTLKRLVLGKENLVKGSLKKLPRNQEDLHVLLEIHLPKAPIEIQQKILKFNEYGHIPYSIAQENAFTFKKVRNHPREKTIAACDINDMSVIIGRYGEFSYEKQIMQEINAWFTTINQMFSMN